MPADPTETIRRCEDIAAEIIDLLLVADPEANPDQALDRV